MVLIVALAGCSEPGWSSDSELSVSTANPPVLSWPSAGSDAVGFEIELDGALVEELDADARRYVLEGFREGTSPRVRVIAIDELGNELGILEREVTLPDRTPPTFGAAATVTATAQGDRARVGWPEAEDNVAIEAYILTVGAASFTSPGREQDVPMPELRDNPTLEVRARDAAGNTSDPISIAWLDTELGQARRAQLQDLQQQLEDQVERMAHDEALGARLRQRDNVALGESTDSP